MTKTRLADSRFLRERVQALVMQRRYTEAVKVVQSASGVPLKKAQEIVAILQRAGGTQSAKRAART